METTGQRGAEIFSFAALNQTTKTSNGRKLIVEAVISVTKKMAPISLLMEEMVERELKMSFCGQRSLTILTSTFEKFREVLIVFSCKNVMLQILLSTEGEVEQEAKTFIFGLARTIIETSNGLSEKTDSPSLNDKPPFSL